MLFHALGVFSATFIFALATLAWVDRGGNRNGPAVLVGWSSAILIIVSMLMFSRLMQRLSDLQISNVLHLIGDQGRDGHRRHVSRGSAQRPAGPRFRGAGRSSRSSARRRRR